MECPVSSLPFKLLNLHADQATAMLEAVNRAVEGGLFYAPIATCSEEAADFASQKIELPSLEWFQLPEAPPGKK